jgi:alcohol dehydrogenase
MPAAHLAGNGMATTGLGLCHAIGHSLGGRFDIPHGVALTMVLPEVLRFNLPACGERLAAVAFAFGAGDTARSAGWNAAAAIDAVTALGDRAGMTHRLADFGITASDFDLIAADALDDEVLANTPRPRPGPTSTPSSPPPSTAPVAWPPPGPAGQGRTGDDEPSGRRSHRACRLTR